ncbi:MAG: redoxin domain-containing protein [Alphaproteobacteria bacterium]|nr:redoxin domain-containing protein [Alphaproteobacteria bacterium]
MDKSLADKLAEIRARSSDRITGINNHLVERLVAAETAQQALKAGDKCPDFALPTAEGEFARVSELLQAGPVVLSFYRGQWCPFCSAELEALHVATPDIHARGAKLVAITPEAGGLAAKVKRERNFGFDILCDLDNGVALQFGLVFRVPDDAVSFFTDVKNDLPTIYDNDSWFLPIPATYIVARDGTIAHAYVNPDFRYRLDPGEIVRVLSDLK